ncbi:MAG: NAD(P)-dependent glycerol-3-phosphate dehydrogenase [Firmicutes bacterium]|nr:NAD(P)-dependent glycerol-3-phosphate dehydrogenase [Bacillota bacterium]
MQQEVVIIGAGGWGTALAVLLARKGMRVSLWGRNRALMEEIAQRRENVRYLPGISLPEEIRPITGDRLDTEGCSGVLLTVPSQGLRRVLRQFRDSLEEPLLINGAKGLEQGSMMRLSQVIEEEIPKQRGRVAVLSGPNHAEEVGRGLPAASVIACEDQDIAVLARDLLMAPCFRVYTNADLIGVELAGALKNVIALAVGIADGLGLGDNAKAAIITRGMVEMARLGVRLGASPLTFTGLSGMGDLFGTCVSKYSRNTRAGRLLGEGHKLDEVLASTNMVVEGIPTVVAAVELARKQGVEMPIASKVYDILFCEERPEDGVSALMQRGAKCELDDLMPFIDPV